LDEEEVNFEDEEESAYVKTEAMDAEICQIFKDLSELKGKSPTLNNPFRVFPLKRES
jgi:hypothetical protein